MAELTPLQAAKISRLNLISRTAGLIGILGGFIYADKTGGKWNRYLGYSLLGAIIIEVPTVIFIYPYKKKILKEADIKTDTKIV